jgi:hypothetical protein
MYIGVALIVTILKYAKFKLFLTEMWNSRNETTERNIQRVFFPNIILLLPLLVSSTIPFFLWTYQTNHLWAGSTLWCTFKYSVTISSLYVLYASLTHSWSWALLEELPIVQLLKTSQHFMEPKGSLARSQGPSTGPYSQPDQFNSYHPILSL